MQKSHLPTQRSGVMMKGLRKEDKERMWKEKSCPADERRTDERRQGLEDGTKGQKAARIKNKKCA